MVKNIFHKNKVLLSINQSTPRSAESLYSFMYTYILLLQYIFIVIT